MTPFEFQVRSFCWYEGITYSPGYGGAVWIWHYRNCLAQLITNRDRDKVMMELAA